MTALIVAAHEAESDKQFETLGYPMLYTGIGKINATMHLIQSFAHYWARKQEPPQLVINLGTAGSFIHPIGSVVHARYLLQRDMLCDGLPGVARYVTPLDCTAPEAILACSTIPLDVPEVICGSGDSFVTQPPPLSDYSIFDMEAYALARVCLEYDLTLIALKCITDAGDAVAWKASLPTSARVLTYYAKQLIAAIHRR